MVTVNAPQSLIGLLLILAVIYLGGKILRVSIHFVVQAFVALLAWIVLMRLFPGVIPPPSQAFAAVLGLANQIAPVVQHAVQQTVPQIQHTTGKAG